MEYQDIQRVICIQRAIRRYLCGGMIIICSFNKSSCADGLVRERRQTRTVFGPVASEMLIHGQVKCQIQF